VTETTSFAGKIDELDAYRRELDESGMIPHLEEQAAYFWRTVSGRTSRGQRYNTGRATGRDGYEEGVHLYATVRELAPEVAVETGVCNGVATAFLLLALDRNGRGILHSIDLPEFAGRDYAPGEFWEGKGGAVVPAGKKPGWMIPEELHGPWRLTMGRSQDELPPLLARVAPIDFFMHDSEHSYECMSFEFREAWEALRPGGVLVSDDIDWNNAFAELAERHGREPVALGAKMALLVK
jgi:predicted O-methyltransferase YrrM